MINARRQRTQEAEYGIINRSMQVFYHGFPGTTSSTSRSRRRRKEKEER
jgi:hypothetical protein